MDEKVKNEASKVLLTKGEYDKMKAIVKEGADGKLKTVNFTKKNVDSFFLSTCTAMRSRISSRIFPHSSSTRLTRVSMP